MPPKPYNCPPTDIVSFAASLNVDVGRNRSRSVIYQIFPAFSQAFPPIGCGCQVKCTVWYSGIDMDAAVILVALIIVFHVSGLRVLADDGIVVRRSGIFHRSERNSL